MSGRQSGKTLRGLTDSVDAAEAFARGEVEYLDEPAELPPPAGDRTDPGPIV